MQADHRQEHLAVRQRRPLASLNLERIEPLLQPRRATHSSSQRQTRMRHQHVVRFRNDELHRLPFLNCRVNLRRPPSTTLQTKKPLYPIRTKDTSPIQVEFRSIVLSWPPTNILLGKKNSVRDRISWMAPPSISWTDGKGMDRRKRFRLNELTFVLGRSFLTGKQCFARQR